ncbi:MULTISPECIES: phenylalanine--tRNA ligase subunit alpha [Caulobacter]|uniref:Phenylalanine--tRNA ligase alpha subunit n=1 Tax=Caulobacter vibrioides OR37 TaxID=1292034 RepID=R0CLI8_CAUVI|nr:MULTISPECIES: phenylalanine--tRNA ligase subunit alpha [Caulobacter]ENZ77365.1 phenylalanyl-tRNA synthetase, alpha subunit [Caulobacter vibrioides OR37]MBQ1561537.1 phenylalanine--tRNA ligase subunit alpha [Caulobacter sp.]
MTDLNTLEADVLAQVAAAGDLSTLDAVRVAAVGKTGSISGLLKTLGAMSPEERKTQGAAINALRDKVQEAIAAKKAALEAAELDARLASETLDLSLPAPYRRKGSVHPTMQTMDEMISIFAEMGFAVAEGPDIEDDFHNFTALNFPEKHPAREMHDTFFFNPKESGERMLLRTHTSPVQVRTMVSQKPPIRIIAPGRTYRCDNDATHTPVFHQVEGLVIDKGIHMGHLKWTLETFLARFFETDAVTTQFRPHHFPFTEPSAEMDVQCDRSGGEIKIGQGTSWLEILGCGMVHPNVLRACGIDPDEYQGFAFGMGVDRLGMLKYGMPDLRDMWSSDVRWLSHYGFSAFAAPNPASGLS